MRNILEAHSSMLNLTLMEARMKYIRNWMALQDFGVALFLVRFHRAKKDVSSSRCTRMGSGWSPSMGRCGCVTPLPQLLLVTPYQSHAHLSTPVQQASASVHSALLFLWWPHWILSKPVSVFLLLPGCGWYCLQPFGPGGSSDAGAQKDMAVQCNAFLERQLGGQTDSY